MKKRVERILELAKSLDSHHDNLIRLNVMINGGYLTTVGINRAHQQMRLSESICQNILGLLKQ